MYTLQNLDFGLTTRCNAACPQCPRTDNSIKKGYSWIKQEEITLDDMKKIVPPSFFKKHNIFSVSFCGGYGDPLLAKDLFEITEYLRGLVRPTATLSIATNGSMKKPIKWWHELGKILSKWNSCEVTFGLDGIDQDMHSKYRVHTNFLKILENAQILQMYGISTRWQYIVFDYNEDFVEEARALSKKYNFTTFHPLTAVRNPIDNDFRPPKDLTNLMTTRGASYNNFTGNKFDYIDCISSKAREVHIPANGVVSPCCFLDERYFIYRYKEEYIKLYGGADMTFQDIIASDNKTVEDIVTLWSDVDMGIFDSKERGLQAVLDEPWWESFFRKQKKLQVNKCNDACGKCSA